MSTTTKPAAAAAAGPPPPAAVTNIIPEFHGATDDWTVYREILEEFYRANGIAGPARVPVLISVIGKDTYRTLRGLCHPRSPKEMEYDELCRVLARQFIPEIAIFRRRSQFYRAEQGRGESVKDWYARLKALSVECQFGEQHLEPLLLDRFVIGLAPGPVQERLCEERPDSLTLDGAVDIAATKEAAMAEEQIAQEFAALGVDDEGHRHRRRGRHGPRHYQVGVGRYHHWSPEHDPRFGHHHHRHGRHHHRHPGHHHSDPEEGHHHHRHHGPPHHFGGFHGHHHWGPIGRPEFGPPMGGHPEEARRRVMMSRHWGAPAFGPGAPAHWHGRMAGRPGMEFGGAMHGCERFGGGRSRERRWAKKWRKHCRRRRSNSSSSSSSSSSSGSSSSSSSSGSSSASETELEPEKRCRKGRKAAEPHHKHQHGKHHHHHRGKRHHHGGGGHGHRHHHHPGVGSGGHYRKRNDEQLQVAADPHTATDPTTEPELIE